MLSNDAAAIEKSLREALVHQNAGRVEQARSIYEEILAVRPAHAASLFLLGQLTFRSAGPTAAIPLFSRAVEANPQQAPAHLALGNCFLNLKRGPEALGCYERALSLRPDLAKVHEMMGHALIMTDRWSEAVASYERAVALDPDCFDACNNAGAALKQLGDLDRAIAAGRRAVKLRPSSAQAHNNLAGSLLEDGRVEEALASYRQAINLSPAAPDIHSNLIFAQHFSPGVTAAQLEAEHHRWNSRHAQPLRASWRRHSNDPDPARRLRVGYVSPDFREHAISYFLVPLLGSHDPAEVEVHCFASAAIQESRTAHYGTCRGLVWHEVASLSDAELADHVRELEIDILVDLSMHTSRNRLPVFARRPAPVQVAWLAYAGTSGLDATDYRLTDARMEPPDKDALPSAEERVRLPDSWCCYAPPEPDLPIGPLPALRPGAGVTFGSLNHFRKINDEVLRCWGKVLGAVLGSRLRLVCAPGERRQQVLERLADVGVEPARVEFNSRVSRLEYLRSYREIDIGLDPLPFNGMTTTCDALWMGVPVLTMYGDLPISRASLGLLATIGLPELAVPDEDALVRAAADLAEDLPRLTRMRAGLRERMKASPLMDAPRFAANVEAAYRQMWRRWCEEEGRRQTAVPAR